MFREDVRCCERFIMETVDEKVHILLGIPILVTVAGESQIPVIPKLPQVSITYIQEFFQALVVIDALFPQWIMETLSFSSFDNLEDSLEHLFFTQVFFVVAFFVHKGIIL